MADNMWGGVPFQLPSKTAIKYLGRSVKVKVKIRDQGIILIILEPPLMDRNRSGFWIFLNIVLYSGKNGMIKVLWNFKIRFFDENFLSYVNTVRE